MPTVSAPTRARGSQPRSAGTRPMRSAAALSATMRLTRATHRRAADRADDRLGDAALAQLAAGDLVHDPSAREDDDPVAQPGQLERVARLDDHRHSLVRLRAQRLVDVEPGADVDALRRLVRQDDVQVAAQERPRQRHLLLVATGQEPYRLLDGGRAHLQPAHELGDGVVLAAAADEAGAAEATQHLDRRVRADAEHGEERLAHAVAAEQEDARAQRRVRPAEVDVGTVALHGSPRPLGAAEAAEQLVLAVPFRPREAEDLAPAQGDVDGAEAVPLEPRDAEQDLVARTAPVALREGELERPADHERDELVI